MTELGRLGRRRGTRLPGLRGASQVNYTELEPGTIKAFHLHRRQTDVWFVPPADKLLLVLVDVRAGSPTEEGRAAPAAGDGATRVSCAFRPGSRTAAESRGVPRPASSISSTCSLRRPAHESDEGRLPWDFGARIWEVVRG